MQLSNILFARFGGQQRQFQKGRPHPLCFILRHGPPCLIELCCILRHVLHACALCPEIEHPPLSKNGGTLCVTGCLLSEALWLPWHTATGTASAVDGSLSSRIWRPPCGKGHTPRGMASSARLVFGTLALVREARVSLPACLHARSVRMLGNMRGSCHTYSRASLQNKDMQADRTLWPTLTSVGTPKSDVRGWPAPQCDTASNKHVWPFKQVTNVLCENMHFDITQ